MTNLNTLIDQYADLKTRQGQLEAEKKALEAALADLPKGSYESADHRLTIVVAISEVPDEELAIQQKAIAAAAVEQYRASLSRQYLTAHTIEKSVRSHRIGLPTGKNLANAA
jgi:phenylpyruvate tautomerase PptA (4-oxalocrotonate tautomerase family)